MLHARKVLVDCQRAHDFLEDETDEILFRLMWVAGIALARTVGHVLDKVDAKRDARLGKIIKAQFANWKANPSANLIFWDFIDDERNRVLKEYSVGFLSGPIPIVADGEIYELDENLFCPLGDGTFA